MNRILDLADGVARWLRHHVRVGLALGAVLAGLLVAGWVLTGDDDADADARLPAGAVATVGDARITQADLGRWQRIYTSAVAGATTPSAAHARRQAFELLAGSTWILEEARRTGVAVSAARLDRAVDAYFTQAKATTAAARAQVLQQLGIGEADLRYQQRVSLLSDGLRARVAKAVPAPSSAAISAAYAAEPQRWARPTRRDLRVVVAPTEATAAAARRSLAQGKSFAAVSAQVSPGTALTAAKGIIPGVAPGKNLDAFERPVFSAPRGRLEGPIRVESGWMVFSVQKVTPLPARTLAQATPAVRASLLSAAQRTATDRFLTDLRARWRARTRCAPSVAVAQFCAPA